MELLKLKDYSGKVLGLLLELKHIQNDMIRIAKINNPDDNCKHPPNIAQFSEHEAAIC